MSVPRKRRFPRTPIIQPKPQWYTTLPGGQFIVWATPPLWRGGGGGAGSVSTGVATVKWPEGERIYTGGPG